MARQSPVPKFTLTPASDFRNKFREVYNSAVAEQGIIITGYFGRAGSALIIFEPDNEKKLAEILERLHGPKWKMPKQTYTMRELRNNLTAIRDEISDSKSSVIIKNRAVASAHAPLQTVAVFTYIDSDDLAGINTFLDKFRGYSPVKRTKQLAKDF